MEVVTLTVAVITILGGIAGLAGIAYSAGQKARTIRNNDQTLAEAHVILHQDLKAVMAAVDAEDEHSLESCPICSADDEDAEVETKTIRKKQQL